MNEEIDKPCSTYLSSQTFNLTITKFIHFYTIVSHCSVLLNNYALRPLSYTYCAGQVPLIMSKKIRICMQDRDVDY